MEKRRYFWLIFFALLTFAVGYGLRGYLPAISQEEMPEGIGGGEAGYSGLIIDARKAGLLPAMSPRILSEAGEEVYGTLEVDLDYVILVGIAGYASSVEEAMSYKDRVGDNPLVVESLSSRGPLKADAVISDSDAQLIKEAVAQKNFLKDYKVIFIVL